MFSYMMAGGVKHTLTSHWYLASGPTESNSGSVTIADPDSTMLSRTNGFCESPVGVRTHSRTLPHTPAHSLLRAHVLTPMGDEQKPN